MIKEDAKKIVKYMLDRAISLGGLDKNFDIQYEDLAQKLQLSNAKYCRVCCQYLNDLHYIRIISNDNGNILVCLKAEGIVFLESM